VLNVLSKKKVYATLDFLFGRTDHQNQGGISAEQAAKIKKLESELENCREVRDLQKELLKTKSR
jgi:Skp family chaperone for outer membrane proteins